MSQTDAETIYAYGPQNAEKVRAEWEALRDAIRERQGAGLTTFGADLPERFWPLLHGGDVRVSREGIGYCIGRGYTVNAGTRTRKARAK